jgi:ribose-phosphate pyrophosphokinase
MMLYATQSTKHICSNLGLDIKPTTVKQFSDGELYVSIHDDVKEQEVVVLSSTIAPAENLLETYFLIDALFRNGATISLFFIYFGYARQDKAKQGEALSGWVVSEFFKTFPLKKTSILHPHNGNLGSFLNFQPVYPFELYKKIIKQYDIQAIVAPDHGITDICSQVAKENNCSLIVCDKKRPQQEHVTMSINNGSAHNKNVLIIDDIITTGNTIVFASQLIKEQQPTNIYACITHGLFTQNAVSAIQQSPIKKLFVTNTISTVQAEGNIEIVDITPYIKSLLMLF